MLDDYCKGQSAAYNILKNAIDKKTVAHAYLFYSDNLKVASEFALCFSKTLLCSKNKLNAVECGNCAICHRIDNNNFPELKIIEPEGLWIKKDQLLNLQEEFRMKPLEGDKKVYIVNSVDKLNVQAANSILKFLEEPEPNIIALMTTSDIRSILPTIISRCQLISLKGEGDTINKNFDSISNKALVKVGQLYYKNVSDLEKFLTDAKNVAKLDAIVLFIKKYETLKFDVLLETKKLWADYFAEKEDYIWAFEMLTLFYKDVLNFMYNKKPEIFEYYLEVIELVASLNKTNDIIHKLQKIILIKEKIKYNINLNLLMDKLIIEMESGERV